MKFKIYPLDLPGSAKDSEEPLIEEDQHEDKNCFCYRNLFL